MHQSYLERLEYLQSAMNNFKSKINTFTDTLLSRIDHMKWLDLEGLGGPITDVDEFMNYVSRWPLFGHMFAACICLSMSTIYHLFYVYSAKTSKFLSKLDYAGISILICGSTLPLINYSYACGEAVSYRKYFLALEIVSCVIVFVITLLPWFDKPEQKKARGILFTGYGVIGSIPMILMNFIGKDRDIL